MIRNWSTDQVFVELKLIGQQAEQYFATLTPGLGQHLAHSVVITDAKHKKAIKLKEGITAAIQQINRNSLACSAICGRNTRNKENIREISAMPDFIGNQSLRSDSSRCSRVMGMPSSVCPVRIRSRVPFTALYPAITVLTAAQIDATSTIMI